MLCHWYKNSHIYTIMDWNNILEHVGEIAYFNTGDTKIKIRINNADTLGNGEKWFNYTFVTHPEFSPVIFGTHLVSANCICEPVKSRAYKGWMSYDIMETLEFEANPQTM